MSKRKAAEGSESSSDAPALNWAMGLARWTTYQAEHGHGNVPEDYKDQQLVSWAKTQRAQYWKWKSGKETFLGEDGFQMLTRFGFPWGKEEVDETEKDVEPSSETVAKPATKKLRSFESLDELDQDKKPAAASDLKGSLSKNTVQNAKSTKAMDLSDGEATETDAESIPEESTSTTGRTLRRPRREPTAEPILEAKSGPRPSRSRSAAAAAAAIAKVKTSAKTSEARKRNTAEDGDSSGGTTKRRKLPSRSSTRKQAPATSTAITAKETTRKDPISSQKKGDFAVKKASASSQMSKTYDVRTLKRLVPHEEEDKVKLNVMEEFESILKCDEPLEVDKEAGVSRQLANYNKAWEDRFVELLVFKKTHGHTLVPKVYPENKPLGRFVARSRAWYKAKEKNLTPSRLKRLEAIDFSWDAKADPDFWRIQNDTQESNIVWDERFQELLDYKKEYGDCLVPKNFPENQVLSRWVGKQRRHHRAKQEGDYHTLDDEKEARLVEQGFVFNTKTSTMIRETVLKRFEGVWDQYIDLLVEFKKCNGHCAVPRRWKSNQPLASWVMRQRFQWKKKKDGYHSYLTEERIKRLKDIGFIFQFDRKKRYPVVDNLTSKHGKGTTVDDKEGIDEEEQDDGEDSSDDEEHPLTSKSDRSRKANVEADGEHNVPNKVEEAPSASKAKAPKSKAKRGNYIAPASNTDDKAPSTTKSRSARSKRSTPGPEITAEAGVLETGETQDSATAKADIIDANDVGDEDPTAEGEEDLAEVQKDLFTGSETKEDTTLSEEFEKTDAEAENGTSATNPPKVSAKADLTTNETTKGDTASTETMVLLLASAKLVKNAAWKCSNCEQEEFESFVDASSHEAKCLDMGNIALPVGAQLD